MAAEVCLSYRHNNPKAIGREPKIVSDALQKDDPGPAGQPLLPSQLPPTHRGTAFKLS